MNFISRFLASNRVRAAARQLSKEPSPRAYAELAHQHALANELDDVLRICDEGLRQFPGDSELKRVQERARGLRVEGRIRELQQEMRTAPRPAQRKELCDLLLEAGRLARAEEAATEWFQLTVSGEAQYYRALARSERFFADRRRDDGTTAFELTELAVDAMPGDPRPLRLHLQLATRIGAWSEARKALARLLELSPGDPVLEARFRTVVALSENARTLQQALREVERTGRLVDDEPERARPSHSGGVRPLLQALGKEPGVNGAFFVRGSTALVQGPRGATAERAARGVREIVVACRAAARRLGLGAAQGVAIEGDFGRLTVVTSEKGCGALWHKGPEPAQLNDRLRELAGAAIDGESAT
jgi:tetratricopeptide (TPR) repeat protein